MTSISSTNAYQSPFTRLQSTLQADISTGSIQSSSQSVLASALESIDGTLSSNRSSDTSFSKPPSPDEMKGKIADLIQQQVDAGTLTSDQADDLAKVFDETFSKGGAGHGPRGAGGSPPGSPPGEEQSSEAAEGSSSSSTSIADMLKELQEALAEGSQTTYSANGSSSSSSSSSYLFDLVA